MNRATETNQQYLDVVRRRVRSIARSQGIPEDQVTPALLLEDFLDRCQALRASSIRFHRSALANWFEHGVKDPLLRSRYLTRLKETRYRLEGMADEEPGSSPMKLMTRKDWETILSGLENLGSSWPLFAGHMIEATLFTGLRPVEWKDARLIEIPSQRLIEAGIVWTELPANKVVCLYAQSAGHTNLKGRKAARLIPLLPDALEPVRQVLELIKRVLDEGKSFAIWQKEIQRGCRRLMQELFPRRKSHYTLLSACRPQDTPPEGLLSGADSPGSALFEQIRIGKAENTSVINQTRDLLIVVGFRRPFQRPDK